MIVEKLQEAYHAEPFQPFVIHLADGRGIPVHHREFMATSPKGRTVVVFQPTGAMNIIDFLLVTDLEFTEPKKPGNGRRKRSR